MGGRPNWAKAPKWANYAAQDANGEWYWYQRMPVTEDREWYDDSIDGRVERAYPEYEGWKSSLEHRP